MSPIESPKINTDEFPSWEERQKIARQSEGPDILHESDLAIKENIYLAFGKDNVLRMMEYYEIDVHVKNAVVTLSGHIVNTSSKGLIENAMRTVPGIQEIKNALVFDDQLLTEIVLSLGKLENTYGCRVFTGVSHGVVSLNGAVGGENVKLLAEQCAADNPNVRGVINNLQIIGDMLPLQEQPLLQPAIGENIYFLDGVCGVVKQVIINTNNRRVIAMTLKGRFVDQRLEDKPSHHGEGGLSEQVLVLPTATVRYLTRVSGFLDIHSDEKNRYMDFDPAHFFSPGADWKAPYPYCLGDVLFPVDLHNMENKILQQLYRYTFSAVLEGQTLREELAANDSLGG